MANPVAELERVNQALAEEEKAGFPLPSGGNLHNALERDHLEETVARLKEELDALEDKVTALRDHDTLEVEEQDIQSFLLEKRTHELGEHVMKELETGVSEDVDEQLRALAQVTGIEFSKAESNMVVSAEGTTIRRYELEGTVRGISFVVGFDVDEGELAVRRAWSTIDKHAMEETENLRKLLTRSCSLRDFFRGLVRYGQVAEQRMRVFEALTKRFPLSVILSHPKSNELLVQPKSHIQFRVEWNVVVDDRGFVQDTVFIYPKVSLQFEQADTRGFLDHFGERFQALHALCGMEDALLALTSVCCKE